MALGCADGAPTSSDFSSTDGGSFGSAHRSGDGGDDGDDGDSEIIVVDLRGTAEGEFRMIDGTEMDCFDVQLFDPRKDRVIGEGTDCLDLASIVGDPTVGAFAISNTTFFHFDDYGSIKSRNRTTIAPVVEGSPGTTHITGDIAVTNNILSGTDEFEDIEGISILRGAVDMSLFFSDNIITFRCLFVLTFDDEDDDD